jgi:acetyl-CoA synthetase
MAPCHILFSSGTSAAPKAIPWNHTTPIKAASDAYLHHNIQAGDVVTWPTNLGWMMGPWLIFATLINHATLALYPASPKERAFGEFIQQAQITLLGVVPSLVASWRQTHCMENLDWRAIRAFTSTGECSHPEDMLYLMSLAGYQPIIEYCGGTEIGGSYITSTLIEKNCPSVFTTPAMGIDFFILDETGHPITHTNITGEMADEIAGEVALVSPSLGLSTTLLNADHHDIYFANMPPSPTGKILRRHGDLILRLNDHAYMMLGRVDDTMNLNSIKISSAAIERVLIGIPGILETAAIAVPPPDGGPNQLIIFAATNDMLNKNAIHEQMQKNINQLLNPLFKIHDLVFLKDLPKTASNKIMRRVLRKQYEKK